MNLHFILIKRIFSDSNNIFLLYESKDVNKKASKIAFDSNSMFTSYA